jgi:hypothetical protein
MATLPAVEGVPPEILEQIAESAAANKRPFGVEVVRLISEGLAAQKTPPPLPVRRSGPPADSGGETAADAPSEVDNAVYNFPRPLTGVPIPVILGGERRPALPIILDETPE